MWDFLCKIWTSVHEMCCFVLACLTCTIDGRCRVVFRFGDELDKVAVISTAGAMQCGAAALANGLTLHRESCNQ